MMKMAAAIMAIAVFAQSWAPAWAQAPRPRATLQTTMGDIVIELDTQNAPRTAANFIRYVKAGYYNDIRIYRVERDFLIQMGDMTSDGLVKTPLYRVIPLETASSAKHARGTVGLAHKSIDSNSGDSTFYIDLADNDHLNADPKAPPGTTGDTVFGRVVEGMDVVDRISKVPLLPEKPEQWFPGATPKTPIIVKKVTLSE